MVILKNVTPVVWVVIFLNLGDLLDKFYVLYDIPIGYFMRRNGIGYFMRGNG